MENLMNYTPEMLEEYLTKRDEKKFKQVQIYEWLYQKQEYDFDNFSNVGKTLIN